ncbi:MULTISPECIES: AzlD domain-containing protein [Arthrobacter]|uniref:AzlD domain-containing protein n=2 Tax=Arthrobacter TaxID=1663 RepID=A0ABU9KKF9_9MICC|nr:AzlD domain-containing protein [Arthrobacter sp. YJM1]MDP5227390.1 AzlD domain-containing protein [Arthrobacter sp. YJM1]
MADVPYLLLGVGAAAAVTFALRAIPFALKGALKDSALLADLRSWMPLGAILILLVYAVSGVDFGGSSHGIPEVSGIVVTAGVHWWRRNAVLSMLAGTAVCLVLANLVF